MDDIFNQEGFLICFPVWLVSRKGHGFDGILKANSPELDGLAVPIFTDEHAAETFLERTSPIADEFELCSVSNHLELLGVLDVLEKNGVAHVLFDPSRRTTNWTIQQMREEIIRLDAK